MTHEWWPVNHSLHRYVHEQSCSMDSSNSGILSKISYVLRFMYQFRYSSAVSRTCSLSLSFSVSFLAKNNFLRAFFGHKIYFSPKFRWIQAKKPVQKVQKPYFGSIWPKKWPKKRFEFSANQSSVWYLGLVWPVPIDLVLELVPKLLLFFLFCLFAIFSFLFMKVWV